MSRKIENIEAVCPHCHRKVFFAQIEPLDVQELINDDRLHKETAQPRSDLAACRERCAALEELLRDIMDTIGEIGQKGPCPVCWTYTHKGWCWFENVKAALAAVEVKP